MFQTLNFLRSYRFLKKNANENLHTRSLQISRLLKLSVCWLHVIWIMYLPLILICINQPETYIMIIKWNAIWYMSTTLNYLLVELSRMTWHRCRSDESINLTRNKTTVDLENAIFKNEPINQRNNRDSNLDLVFQKNPIDQVLNLFSTSYTCTTKIFSPNSIDLTL